MALKSVVSFVVCLIGISGSVFAAMPEQLQGLADCGMLGKAADNVAVESDCPVLMPRSMGARPAKEQTTTRQSGKNIVSEAAAEIVPQPVARDRHAEVAASRWSRTWDYFSGASSIIAGATLLAILAKTTGEASLLGYLGAATLGAGGLALIGVGAFAIYMTYRSSEGR